MKRAIKKTPRHWVVWIVLAIAIPAALLLRRQRPSNPYRALPSSSEILKMAKQLGELQEAEAKIAERVFAKELVAERAGRVVEQFWDELNHALNRWAVVSEFGFGKIWIGSYEQPFKLPHAIAIYEPLTNRAVIQTQDEFRSYIAPLTNDWQIVQTEFRHNRFDAGSKSIPAKSTFYISLHLANTNGAMRAIVEGDLAITWNANFSISEIDAGRLQIRTRNGEPPFTEILNKTVSAPPGSFFIDPLITYDLKGEGTPEIILAAANLVLHRDAEGKYQSAQFLEEDPGLVFTGVIADFTGDGIPDFLCAKFEGLFLYQGAAGGKFPSPGRQVWVASPHLNYGQVLTCGDIDGDGDLDIFLAQYKPPYQKGQMPSPWFDATDGHPSYLLVNDGKGNLSDATEASGLGVKRSRRTYSASFVDIDNDGDLDLVVVSDFSGLDTYANDGHGHFADLTGKWAPAAKAFGMAHTFADFNHDGALDLLMIGMNSPTADRLNALGLVRAGHHDIGARQADAFGNRLLLWNENKLEQSDLAKYIARSGWSWGASAFDFDNDGWADVYIANGHETRSSVREYEPEFWLHDIYVGSSRDSAVNYAYFESKNQQTRYVGFSYGGNERNRFFRNLAGGETRSGVQSFTEVAFLLGVALPEDSRNVLADDLDGDGRMDLLVTTFEIYPEKKQTIRIFKNNLPDAGNWIGFRFAEQHGKSPIGAKVTIHYGNQMETKQIVTGDSFRTQHSPTVHFGIGAASAVDRAEIRWINGPALALTNLPANHWQVVK